MEEKNNITDSMIDKNQKKKIDDTFMSMARLGIDSIEQLQKLNVEQWIKEHPTKNKYRARSQLNDLKAKTQLLEEYGATLRETVEIEKSLIGTKEHMSLSDPKAVKRRMSFFNIPQFSKSEIATDSYEKQLAEKKKNDAMKKLLKFGAKLQKEADSEKAIQQKKSKRRGKR